MRTIEKSNPCLYGVFGDAIWTNKDRLPDRLLVSLIKYSNQIPLGVKDIDHDDLGNAYEYFIKQLVDDFGHTAVEFYTNHTVAHLMARILGLQLGETAYDLACGTWEDTFWMPSWVYVKTTANGGLSNSTGKK